MKDKRYAGGITVYFAMIVLSVLMLFLAVLWLTMRYAEKNDCLRMTQTAGNAALGSYQEELADWYGLFGTDRRWLERRVQGFLRMNEKLPIGRIRQLPQYLLQPTNLWKGLFAYKSEQVDAVTLHTLDEKDILLDQIDDFMGYHFVEEGMELLMGYLKDLQEAADGSSIEARYAGLQQLILEYGENYEKLVRCFYPERGAKVYITMTEQEKYRPSMLYSALQRLSGGGKTIWYPEIVEKVDWWRQNAGKLSQQNAEAARLLRIMSRQVVQIQDKMRDMDLYISNLSQEEQAGDRVKRIVEEIAGVKDKLWGLHGEIEPLMADVLRNEKLAEALTVPLEQVMTEYWLLRDLPDMVLQRALSAAEGFMDYKGDLKLEYERRKGASLWDLSELLRWIRKWKIDLHPYGEDEWIINDNSWVDELWADDSLEDALDAAREGGKSLLAQIYDKAALMEYGVGMFCNLQDQVQAEKGKIPVNLRHETFPATVFRNETEFLIHGSYNEYRNLKGVQYRILGIRLMMNLLHLLTDSEKQARIQTIAEGTGGLIVPGVGTGIAYGVIIIAWAAAESYVDYSILLQGGKVPIVKTADEWHTSLEKVLKKKAEEVMQDSEEAKGLDYETYLRILLLMTDRDTLLNRMQELIERNLRAGGAGGFSMDEMSVAYRIVTVISGRVGRYESAAIFRYE